jgi:hypothetical protein
LNSGAFVPSTGTAVCAFTNEVKNSRATTIVANKNVVRLNIS